ncbi:glucosyl-dolichyl phosphate glucuronosyltransferase [Natrialbaceae archaeon GCM10025810]|uniref:glucosyl-dolichyl phosphate glucuronosyltransferase n=1 Tax=Halovalidus salilacus TaxID=3075124 RepID=UPI003613266F
MKVSVVINSYSLDRYDDFCEAIDAVLEQTYDPIELVLVIDGNQALYERTKDDFGHLDGVVIHRTEENVGNSASRTVGGMLASGDIVAVTDDDGVADPNWVEELVAVYEETDAIAVGGKVVPQWIDGKPPFFPEEFYWLVGCNHRGFEGEHMSEVRNTFGPNLSFRAEVFEALGGFSHHVGRHGEKQLQAHETEICSRMHELYGCGVIYTEDAVINHKVYPYRNDPKWLFRRCFWQGYSKRVLEQLIPDSTGNEQTFLKRLLVEFIPNRLTRLIKNPSTKKAKQLTAICLFTITIGLGYLYALVSGDLIEEREESTISHTGGGEAIDE